MQYTNVLALASLAAAAPLAARDSYGTFGVISAHSASPVHLRPWVVRNGGVFLSGDASAYCPSDIQNLDCSQFKNTTAFGAQVGDSVGLGLDTEVPGGQSVYTAKDGALGYTLPHSAAIPEGATQGGFSYKAPEDGAAFGYLSSSVNGATGFVACPTSNSNEYQIFANVAGGSFDKCIGVDALAPPFTGAAAWEYTA